MTGIAKVIFFCGIRYFYARRMVLGRELRQLISNKVEIRCKCFNIAKLFCEIQNNFTVSLLNLDRNRLSN